ncbi:hypothetical protein BO86DRAFT_220445 [Aspergillus japonicus CBS 114.51]|uniref:Uncharacterized protein n=2 Tax=Aspergillus TaxID=5052 RepID=A0A2V5HD92_ASPV1|nr:hypothetical protein BO86DRAFT_220445 [Aspergillus japonicus CBS 114.51]PYI19794.1 hypothetical protein BO99DRAFT_133692 [Aspergillus violaceofuscus CBS 115571]RAH77453.1 hypothetical protein BO86DRAFT_220445 [Aspergillus japonicus CBS 114.51]
MLPDCRATADSGGILGSTNKLITLPCQPRMAVISINCINCPQSWLSQSRLREIIPLASIGLIIGGQEVLPRPDPPMHQDSRGVTEASGLRAVGRGGYTALGVCTVSTVTFSLVHVWTGPPSPSASPSALTMWYGWSGEKRKISPDMQRDNRAR